LVLEGIVGTGRLSASRCACRAELLLELGLKLFHPLLRALLLSSQDCYPCSKQFLSLLQFRENNLPLGLQQETAHALVDRGLVCNLVQLGKRPIRLRDLYLQLLFLGCYCLKRLLKLLQSSELFLQLRWKLNFFGQVFYAPLER
jgi:hypothetical protein